MDDEIVWLCWECGSVFEDQQRGEVDYQSRCPFCGSLDSLSDTNHQQESLTNKEG